MATNKVEIELEISGTEEAVESLEGIGETASAMADQFQKDNSHLGEGLGDLTGNIGDALDSVKGLGSAFTAQGASMMSLIPAFGAVVAAGFALYETYLNISGAAQEAEEAQENMAAAVADLQSKLEALAEKGVVPTASELSKFTEATILAQFAKDDLENSMTKNLTPAMKKHREELKRLTDLQDKSREGDKLSREEAVKLGKEIVAQNTVVTKSREDLNKAAAVHRDEQLRVIHAIKSAAEQEEAFEEKSAEARLAIVKENQAKLETLLIMQKQAELTETQAKVFESQQKEITALSNIQIEANKEDVKFLKEKNDALKAVLSTLNEEQIITAKARKDRAGILKQAADKEAAEDEKRLAQAQARRAAYRAKRLAKERQTQAELQQIRNLEIQGIEISGASALEILNLRYQEEIKLAEGSANKTLIAVKRYENQISLIRQDAEEKRIEQSQAESVRLADEERQRAEQRANLIYDSLEFDANLSKDATTRELRLLDIKYAKEIELNKHTQEEITELNRRQAIERQNIIDQSIDNQIEKVGEFSSQYGAGLAEAAYSSILFGESFSEATGQILIALGRQAAVQALMETAKGTAALFSANPAAASSHFTAAGMFLGASAAAGVAGKALGGGGGGSGSASSPMGTPQTAPTPERETAEESAMVFNINFGGAVIYDTQRAAEQALADRITNLQNTRRRGAPRRSF